MAVCYQHNRPHKFATMMKTGCNEQECDATRQIGAHQSDECKKEYASAFQPKVGSITEQMPTCRATASSVFRGLWKSPATRAPCPIKGGRRTTTSRLIWLKWVMYVMSYVKDTAQSKLAYALHTAPVAEALLQLHVVRFRQQVAKWNSEGAQSSYRCCTYIRHKLK